MSVRRIEIKFCVILCHFVCLCVLLHPALVAALSCCFGELGEPDLSQASGKGGLSVGLEGFGKVLDFPGSIDPVPDGCGGFRFRSGAKLLKMD